MQYIPKSNYHNYRIKKSIIFAAQIDTYITHLGLTGFDSKEV